MKFDNNTPVCHKSFAIVLSTNLKIKLVYMTNWYFISYQQTGLLSVLQLTIRIK